MEVGVELLRLIFVLVDSKFVMMSRLVLPLHLGLNSEQSHEVVKFDIVVLFAQLLILTEEPVTWLSWLNDVLRRPLFFITFLLFAIVAIVCFFITFLVFVSIIIITSTLRSIELFFFLLNVGVAFSYNC